MGITERNAQKDTIDKYLRFHWGDYPHVFTGALEGKTQWEGAEMFTNQIVKLAQEDGIELKPADVARRAADHLAGQNRTGVHWRIMDDYRRDLEQEDAQSPPYKGEADETERVP